MSKLVLQANLGGAVSLVGPNTANFVDFTLPSADGAANTVMTTNGAGTLSFQSVPTITSAGNLVGGSAGTIPYQSATDTTAMLAAGTSGYFLKSNGAAAPSWAVPTTSIARSTKTANYTLVSGDKGNLVVATSGTFTFAFTAAATLGTGWCVYLQNSGTGEITLDPNGSETIDGLTSYIMYPGEARLVQCDGSGFNSIVLNGFYTTFLTSGTFTKPPGYSQFAGLIWGAGGGGGKNGSVVLNYGVGAGGGGACFPFTYASSALSSSETVTIGAGGAGASTNYSSAGAGGYSQFKSVKAYGGGGGYGDTNGGAQCGGGGGGAQGAGVTATQGQNFAGGAPAQTLSSGQATNAFGGGGGYGGGGNSNSVYGGSGGGGNGASGNTIYGGVGGEGGYSQGSGFGLGTTVYGGMGGAFSISGTAGNGVQPGGGGGATATGTAGSGAAGQLILWGVV